MQGNDRSEEVQRNGTNILDRWQWQWELQKRKEAIQEVPSPLCSSKPKVHIIDPASLHDPTIDGKPTEVYIGRGSFSVFRLQYYRGIKVAVKEFLPRSMKVDVAAILSLLNHPYLHIFHTYLECVYFNTSLSYNSSISWYWF